MKPTLTLLTLVTLLGAMPPLRAQQESPTVRSADQAVARKTEDPAVQPTITLTPPSPRDVAWDRVITALASGPTQTTAALLKRARLAGTFHTEFPNDANAIEARKLEALFLIDAARAGDADAAARVPALVQAFRRDPAVPSFQRAVVAGTYEFSEAGKRIHSRADLDREYETVSRSLMKEFPRDPQGYVSLLTQASGRDHATARALASEIVDAGTAPPSVHTSAQRLLRRLDLVGQPVHKVLGQQALGPTAKAGWPSKQPGLIYVWATWSPESVALGESLAARKLGGINVVSICLDRDKSAASRIVTGRKLPGRVLYDADTPHQNLAAQLGADTAPLLYLVDADGVITDVRGLDGLAAKLQALGL